MAVAYVDAGTETLIGGGSTVTFTSGAPAQVDSDAVFLWDFDNDGDFDEAEEDITGYVIHAQCGAGRDWPSQINGKSSPGMLELRLLNSDNRFSFFNQDSPLNQGSYSLSTGRKIRVRLSTAADNDPVELARDRFNRTDSTLGHTENGLIWTQPTVEDFAVVGRRCVAGTAGSAHLAVVNVGQTGYYAQVVIAQTGARTSGAGNNRAGLVYRYQDSNDYSLFVVDLNAGQLQLIDVVAGVESTVATAGVDPSDGMTLGVWVESTTVRGLLDGVYAIVGTAIQTDEPQVGIYANWGTSNLRPELDEFYVWTLQPDEDETLVSAGTIWTGYITEVIPDATPGPQRYCTVKAEGALAQLAEQETNSPRYIAAQRPGFMVGRVLSEARFLNPPGRVRAIQPGARVTGPVSSQENRGRALEFVRRFEDHEIGFLHEAPEGHIEFDQYDHRAFYNGTPQSTWSDAAGGQFGYESIELLSWSRELVNRVEGGIAPRAATLGTTSGSFVSTAAGVAANLTYTIPSDVQDGELLIFVVSSTVQATASADWPVPQWWVPERRDIQDNARGCRVFTHISDGTDGGSVVTFYSDTGNAGGSHVWFAFRLAPGNWFGNHEGIHLAEFQPNSVPPIADPPWGAVPTWYLAIRSGVISSGGASVGATIAPIGFDGLNSEFVNSATNAFDNVLQYARRHDNVGLIKPTGFNAASLTGFIIVTTTVLMVRGYNGSPPEPTDVVRSTLDSLESQDRHNRIATYKSSSDLFMDDNQVEDFAGDVFAVHADDRPIFRISFTATQNAAYMGQAANRRVNDRVTLVGDNDTGMGVSGDFYIERIEHEWSDGGKRWVVTWDLSPAPSRTIDGPV